MNCEKDAAVRRPDSRVGFLSDSQVSLGAYIKGRSSSGALNQELCVDLCYAVSFGIYGLGSFCNTKDNVADDTTRNVPVRRPVQPPPDWWPSLRDGDLETFDRLSKGLSTVVVEGLTLVARALANVEQKLNQDYPDDFGTIQTLRDWNRDFLDNGVCNLVCIKARQLAMSGW